MEWIKDWNTNLLQKVIFHIFHVDAHVGIPSSSNWAEGKRAEKRAKKIDEIQKYLSSSELSLVSYINTHLKAQITFLKTSIKRWLEMYSDNFPLYVKDEELCGEMKDNLNLKDILFTLPKENIDLM